MVRKRERERKLESEKVREKEGEKVRKRERVTNKECQHKKTNSQEESFPLHLR